MDASTLAAISLFTAVVVQLGMGVGVGASTFTILSFLRARRDGHIDEKEQEHIALALRVLRWSLFVTVVAFMLQASIAATVGVWDRYATASWWMSCLLFVLLFVHSGRDVSAVLASNWELPVVVGIWYVLYLIHTLRFFGVVFPREWITLSLFAMAVVLLMVGVFRLVEGGLRPRRSSAE